MPTPEQYNRGRMQGLRNRPAIIVLPAEVREVLEDEAKLRLKVIDEVWGALKREYIVGEKDFTAIWKIIKKLKSQI